MPDLAHLTDEQRADALREYVTSAPDRAAAVEFLLGALDPIADLPLLVVLEEIAPEEFTAATPK